ncbi:hypothetical protein pdam_00019515 [Pocillopora damicornis]|uniref:Enoyl reductase (ER) domain-containing protein n=1 Tax=Pocillopora damicornis TaxID=46731 RepID=A0A3M6TS84_POCDA|nr:hypothetical protein pdam_00019515 [Pocillopora damicornis]
MYYESYLSKPITCRAAVAWEANTPLVIETIEVAPPNVGEVRVKLVAAGVCHSDENFRKGHSDDVFPGVFGHEASGIIESIGEGVRSVKPGDHVIPLLLAQCGECAFCKNSRTNFCVRGVRIRGEMLDGTKRSTSRGKPLCQLLGVGAFSEYAVLPEIAVAKVEPGSSTAVWGLGGVGLSAVMGCKAAGATRIIGIDIKPEKFQLAKELGCTECVNPKDHDKPIQQVLKEMTEGGVNYSVECVGNVETMRAAFEASHPILGTTVLVGIAPQGEELKINPRDCFFGRTIIGTLCGGFKGKDGITQLSEKYMAGTLKLDKIISHTMPLDKINEAFDLMHAGKSIRTVIHF